MDTSPTTPGTPQQNENMVPPAGSAETSNIAYEPNPFKLLLPAAKAIRPNIGSYLIAFLLPALLIGVIVIGAIAFLATRFDLSIATLTDPQALLVVAGVVILSLLLAVALAAAPLLVVLASARQQRISGLTAIKRAPGYAVRLVLVWLRLLIEATLPLLVAGVVGLVLFSLELEWLTVLLVGVAGVWTIINIVRLVPAFSLAPFALIDDDTDASTAITSGKSLGRGRILDVIAVLALMSAGSILFDLLDIAVISTVFSFAYSVAVAPAIALRYVQLKANPTATSVTGLNALAVTIYLILAIASSAMSVDHTGDSSMDEAAVEDEIERLLERLSD